MIAFAKESHEVKSGIERFDTFCDTYGDQKGTTVKTNRPNKPYPEFPLFPNQNGQWCRKVKVGSDKPRPYYFGKWSDDPKGERALREWQDRKASILAGVDQARPVRASGGMLLVEAIRQFLEAKNADTLAGDFSDLTLQDYINELQKLADFTPAALLASYGPNEFSAYLNSQLRKARKLGTHRLAVVVRYLRAFFNYAVEQGWRPAVQFGADFVPPSTDPDAIAAAKVRRGEDADADPVFSRRQIRWLLKRATPAFRAMILLALNCGIGPADIGKLRWRHIDLESGRLKMRRGKNGIRREAYLWKRTREALKRVAKLKHTKAAIAAEGDEALVFITRKGEAYVRAVRTMEGDRIKKTTYKNAVSITFGRWIDEARAAGIVAKGAKLTFYNLRHTYYTHAENGQDTNAVCRTMGHALIGTGGKRYKKGAFPLPRLKRVAIRVLKRIWPAKKPATPPAPAPATKQTRVRRAA